MSNATANHALKCLRMVFGSAKKDGYLSHNPAEDVPVLKRKSSASPRRSFTIGKLQKIITEADWDKKKYDWIPSPDDKAFIKTLMKQVIEPGKIAGWVAPPPRGINNHDFDFEYVKL